MTQRSGARARASAGTRQLLLRAARAALSDPDPAAWSMEAVATAAGVTRMTVYNQFGSRTALVEAVLDEVVARDRMDRLVEGTRELAPAAALEAAIATTCAFWHAERPLLRRLSAAAYDDPAVAELLSRREGWRTDQLRALLARSGDALPDGLDERGAADLLTAVTSFAAYDRLAAADEGPQRAAELLTLLAQSLGGTSR